jgi:hypothetical protein
MDYGDNYDGERIFGVCEATVVNRNDPKGDGRITVRIEGLMAESPWARPQGAGAKNWGGIRVPPQGAIVLVEFIRGNPQHPTYRPGWLVRPGGVSTAVKEFESPDVAYEAIGPFRLVIDNREGQRSATWAMVREVNGVEQNIIELTYDYEHNSARLAATTGLKIEAKGLIDIDASTVQIKKRVINPSNRPIN